MRRTFIQLNTFSKRWDTLGLADADLRELEDAIMKNPEIGDLIQGAGGLRKLRFALPNKGKSSGIRVLYVDYAYYEVAVLMNVFAKGNQDNISEKEKKDLQRWIAAFLKELRK